jgi:hypothetical protein
MVAWLHIAGASKTRGYAGEKHIQTKGHDCKEKRDHKYVQPLHGVEPHLVNSTLTLWRIEDKQPGHVDRGHQ